ncbi:gamma-glutamyltransferase [Gordonia sp. HY002]|uniref:gamma-glutamyltransferase family protein n=1 Tax=Gordonia zhenghanii TaxID=2911516 RepID=UPI001EEF8504|nr:gamma-glutamyltransferase [Gordonia zhenghanii]MCF8570980.1 gamma-glutamyltransferase [Gordonia zhenghanii]MCF8604723.1 gamma-glutamyltransferase [Gordonia zhenghanii]
MTTRIGRPSTMATRGMVASSHPLASTAGLQVLASGGNAVDAALCAAAMTWMTLPGQCGIGGDAFAVVSEPDGSVWTVNGSGYGPDGGSADFYRDAGFAAIPLDGPLAVAVPGAPAALAALHARGATRSLEELWEPAARVAEQGLPCSAKTRDDVREALEPISNDRNLREALTDDGQVPLIGSRRSHSELATTIRRLAADPASFYTGELGERCVDALRSGGAPFTGEEWLASGVVAPQSALTTRYGGAVIHQTPLPSAGWMVLQQAQLCGSDLGMTPWLSADAIQRMTGAARLSFEDRFSLCGADNDGAEHVLTAGSIAQGRARLADGLVGSRQFAVSGGDTTSLVVVDSDGRSVSFIHSLAFTFGAKFSVPGTGIVLNNRLGRGSYLINGHPNEVRPRRKPLHTLNAWVVTDDAGRLSAVGNTPGGDGQVQWNMQLLSHLLDHGLDPQEAVSAPRFTVFPGADANTIGMEHEVRVETSVAPDVRAELRRRGHVVRDVTPFGEPGSAQVISADPRGILLGGSDPRQEGVALGLE